MNFTSNNIWWWNSRKIKSWYTLCLFKSKYQGLSFTTSFFLWKIL